MKYEKIAQQIQQEIERLTKGCERLEAREDRLDRAADEAVEKEDTERADRLAALIRRGAYRNNGEKWRVEQLTKARNILEEVAEIQDAERRGRIAEPA